MSDRDPNAEQKGPVAGEPALRGGASGGAVVAQTELRAGSIGFWGTSCRRSPTSRPA